MSIDLLKSLQLVQWRAEQKLTGRKIMDTSPHTVTPEFLSAEVHYTFEVVGPPGLHPEEVVGALRGAPVTRVTEPSKAMEHQRYQLEEKEQELRSLRSLLAGAQSERDGYRLQMQAKEAELTNLRGRFNAQDRESKDNKAKLDALSLLGTTMDEIGFEKLAKTELDHWMRGLDDFNMTSGEAEELRAMMLRLAKTIFARAEVLRDKPRCALLLEAIQREADQKTQVPSKPKSDDEDQLF